uniref:Uncharacterized protein n=1 Tax=Rhizophora mucronata TaxID=61149 RepID=A0A2P2P604_RHIMU
MEHIQFAQFSVQVLQNYRWTNQIYVTLREC